MLIQYSEVHRREYSDSHRDSLYEEEAPPEEDTEAQMDSFSNAHLTKKGVLM